MSNIKNNGLLICIMILVIISLYCAVQAQGLIFHGSLKDKTGNLWFATIGEGIYRYDAGSGIFSNYTKRDGLCSDNISTILEDKAGNLWFGTSAGVCRFDGKSFTVISSGMCDKTDVLDILESKSGDFWFCTNGYGVCRYNPVTEEIINFTKEQG